MALLTSFRVLGITCLTAAAVGCTSDTTTTASSEPIVRYHAVRSGAEWVDLQRPQQLTASSAAVSAAPSAVYGALSQELALRRGAGETRIVPQEAKTAIFTDPAPAVPDAAAGDQQKRELFTEARPIQDEGVAPAATPAALLQQPAPIATAPDRSAIAARIVRRSIAGYSGNCPCPFNTDRAGRSCGARNAWSRPGGEAPMCYESDITDGMISAFRE